MKDGALFCHVDLLAAKHRVDPVTQSALLGKLHQ
jgi:hypothetical protein